MPEPFSLSLVLAAAGLAAVASALRGEEQERLGPIPLLDEEDEVAFELFWLEDGQIWIEGLHRRRSIQAEPHELLRSLRHAWVERVVDSSSIGEGSGCERVWIRTGAIKREREAPIWAFRDGTPMRTRVVTLQSGRQICGILPAGTSFPGGGST